MENKRGKTFIIQQQSVRMLLNEIRFAIHGRSTSQIEKSSTKASIFSVLHEPFVYEDRMKSVVKRDEKEVIMFESTCWLHLLWFQK